MCRVSNNSLKLYELIATSYAIYMNYFLGFMQNIKECDRLFIKWLIIMALFVDKTKSTCPVKLIVLFRFYNK